MSQEIKVKRTHIHPNFTSKSLRAGGDIAILELAEDSTLEPIPLPYPYYVPEGKLLALGWGLVDTILQQVYLEVQSEATCEEAWEGIGPSIICASSPAADTCRGKEPVDEFALAFTRPSAICLSYNVLVPLALVCEVCSDTNIHSGDSGGPLILPHAPERKISDGKARFDSLIALTSFGDSDCSRLERAGAYTLIAPYLFWIESIMSGHTELSSPQVVNQ